MLQNIYSMQRLQFLRKVLTLKDVKRTGWTYKDIPLPESVADHMFGVAMLAFTVPLPENVNRDKLVKMALVHDIGECIIGDQVWETGKHSNDQKHLKKNIDEKKAIKDLFSELDNHEAEELAIEYVDLTTPEAKFLKELDKLEMVLQALVYEQKVAPDKLNEFWENAQKYIKDKTLLSYFDELRKERFSNKK
jgi:putative hydrolases of HD superfamily